MVVVDVVDDDANAGTARDRSGGRRGFGGRRARGARRRRRRGGGGGRPAREWPQGAPTAERDAAPACGPRGAAAAAAAAVGRFGVDGIANACLSCSEEASEGEHVWLKGGLDSGPVHAVAPPCRLFLMSTAYYLALVPWHACCRLRVKRETAPRHVIEFKRDSRRGALFSLSRISRPHIGAARAASVATKQ